MLKINQIYQMNCLLGIQKMLEQNMQVDLIVTDPPYFIKSTKAGGKSELARSIQPMNDELSQNKLTGGIEDVYLKAMWDVMKVPNIYIWCNGAQIPQYIDFFVRQRKCKMDIIVWRKTNATPLFCNKYLSDKEYCLYFRRGAYCQPPTYEQAKTVYELPINIKDKRLYGHPTVKPLPIVRNLVENSSKKGYLVLDPFILRCRSVAFGCASACGSGTTAVACKELGRNFIGFEINPDYHAASLKRLAATIPTEVKDEISYQRRAV